MKQIQVIATDFSPRVLTEDKLYYLGPWCNQKKKNQKNKVLKYVWSEKKELKKDYNYLNILFKKIIKSLPKYLNKYHNTNLPNIFWKSIIWVWLSFYLSSTFLKWRSFSNGINKNKKKKIKFVQVQFDGIICSKDTHSYKNFIQESDIFNEYEYSKISNFLKDEVDIIKKKKSYVFNFNYKFKYRASILISKIIKTVINFIKIKILKTKAIVYQGLKIKNLFRLTIQKLKLPIFIDEVFPIKSIKLKKLKKHEIKKRKKIKFKFNVNNNYENYLMNNIFLDIPISFLEDFQEFQIKAKKLNIKTDLIVSSIGHYFNDKYKIWLFFKKIFEKSKLIIIEHGGNHSVSRHSSFFNYDNIVGDVFIPWDKSSKLPAEKYIGFKNKKKLSKNLLYVGHETDKYPSKTIPDISTINELESIPNLDYLNKNLNKNTLKKLVYVEKKIRDKRTIERIKKIIGKDKTKKMGTFLNELRKTKLAICDYPQTSYFDCLITCPTIMVFDYQKEWTPLKKFFKLYNILKKNNMLFKDIQEATKFINKNWDQIDIWWNSGQIVNVRKIILDEFCIDTNIKGANKWYKFLNNKSNLK